MILTRNPGSFRDPCGFVFTRDDVVYRQINEEYRPHYERLTASGLYDELVVAGLLVGHEEVDVPGTGAAWRVIRPDPIPFISYPYEWSFGQLKAAALLTLDIQRRSLARGLTLRDASAYNVQFVGGRPVFIDTLSVGLHEPGEPWVAYQQFCRHFLAPLALMSAVDVSLGQLARVHIDGIPLRVATRLLPWSSLASPGLFVHLQCHAIAIDRYGEAPKRARPRASGARIAGLVGLIDHLAATIEALKWEPKGTEWADYYGHTNYSAESTEQKRRLVTAFLGPAERSTVWDLGANTGAYSAIAADLGARVVGFDLDPAAVELHWRSARQRIDGRVLPLLQDLTNPSAGLGWGHEERSSLVHRGPADTCLALALVHHLAIGNNVPFDRIAGFLSRLGRRLIIEFVPRTDSQVARMLATRGDTFPTYDLVSFETAFDESFRVLDRRCILGSDRQLYLMERRG